MNRTGRTIVPRDHPRKQNSIKIKNNEISSQMLNEMKINCIARDAVIIVVVVLLLLLIPLSLPLPFSLAPPRMQIHVHQDWLQHHSYNARDFKTEQKQTNVDDTIGYIYLNAAIYYNLLMVNYLNRFAVPHKHLIPVADCNCFANAIIYKKEYIAT